MKVTVQFDPRDDLDVEYINRIEGTVLTRYESELAVWQGHTLTYRTDRCATDVISDWESEGFNLDEFVSFTLSR